MDLSSRPRNGPALLLLLLAAASSLVAAIEEMEVEVGDNSVAMSFKTIDHRTKPYIVYLGGHRHTREDVALIDQKRVREFHHSFLSSVLGSEEKAHEAMFYSYTNFINAFAANLEENDAAKLKSHADVISVFEDKAAMLTTTYSWTFLGLENNGIIPQDSAWREANFGGNDVIVGVVDTSVVPESRSFNDEGMGPIPSRWRGKCHKHGGIRCNRKLIGARVFDKGYRVATKSPIATARDFIGHGTHCLSTIGGQFVAGVDAHSGANATVKGGAPRVRLASYRVCGPSTSKSCFTSDILKGIDTAIHDGVDVISISLGLESNGFINDPFALGALHAMMHGILIVKAVGNDGPVAGTVGNLAPWMLSVGATSTNREFPSYAILGNGVRLKGQSLSQDKLKEGKFYPLIDASKGVAPHVDISLAERCLRETLDVEKVEGKIVVCHSSGGNNSNDAEGEALIVGAIGMIYVNAHTNESVNADRWTIPATHLSYEDGITLLSYMNSTRNPTAFITFPKSKIDPKSEAYVLKFSSRGPDILNPEFLKPDITAPGLNIIAAWTQPAYIFNSGTSMACPHVAAIAALVKSVHPKWSPSAIKSAIITTATIVNISNPTYKGSGPVYKATPFDAGSGLVNAKRAMDPGLVYDAKPVDYLNLICALGLNPSQMGNFTHGYYACPDQIPKMIDFNYPTISVPNLSKPTTITRRVKNVGCPGMYKVLVEEPVGIKVTVIPSMLEFTDYGLEKQYYVTFEAMGTAMLEEFTFGSLTWTDGAHYVRSVLVVRPTAK